MRIHVVGVAGTAMGSLAGLLTSLGHDVSGSDVAFDPPIGPELERWGVTCFKGYSPDHLDASLDLVVIGNVCRPDNPEARAAIDGGFSYTHVAGALRRFVLEGTRPLVVAGTHGKTTTTSMAAWLLDATGYAPGFLVGGIPKNFPESFRAPKPVALPVAGDPRSRSRPFVLEGDEYDTAFFEKTAKFLHYAAEIAIVTSIEHDHIDIYPTLESYLDAFRRFVATVPKQGLIVANAADPLVVDLVDRHARADVAWYALQDDPATGPSPHYLAAPATTSPRETTFDFFAGGVACGRFSLPMSGEHNLRNAAAALGAVAQGFGAPLHELSSALARYQGVKRRQEVIGEPGGVTVYDDFAHHPTAVKKTLVGLRARHPSGRLFAVFEPRSATACRSLHQDAYPEAFEAADAVMLAPLGRSHIAPDEALDLARLVRDLSDRGTSAAAFESVDAIVARLAASAERGDVIAVMSNGAFGGIHKRLLDALGSRD